MNKVAQGWWSESAKIGIHSGTDAAIQFFDPKN
jgi:hypothetical protein